MGLNKFIIKKINYKNFFIRFTNNTLIFVGKWGFYKYKFQKALDFKVLVINNKVCLILDLINFNIFLNQLHNILCGLTYRWFSFLELEGLGFRLYGSIHQGYLKMNLGYSHLIFIFNLMKLGIYCFFRKYKGKKILILIGLKKFELMLFTKFLQTLRPTSLYKFKGLRLVNKLFKVKKIKNKKVFI